MTERHLTTVASVVTSRGTVVIRYSRMTSKASRPQKRKGSNPPSQEGLGQGVIGRLAELHSKPLYALLRILLLRLPPLFPAIPLSLVSQSRGFSLLWLIVLENLFFFPAYGPNTREEPCRSRKKLFFSSERRLKQPKQYVQKPSLDPNIVMRNVPDGLISAEPVQEREEEVTTIKYGSQ